MKKRSFSFVSSHRKHWALSAEEFARLIGRDASTVCRLEKCQQPPSGKVAIGCEVIFGVPPQDMFPGLYEQVEDAIMARAARFHEQLKDRTDRTSARKRELLDDMMQRATAKVQRP